MSSLAAGLDFDDPIDTFGQLYITEGGRWYQRRSIPELDELYNQQKAEQDFDKRRELVWEMDKIATNDARLPDSALVAVQSGAVGLREGPHFHRQRPHYQRENDLYLARPARGQPQQPITIRALRMSADLRRTSALFPVARHTVVICDPHGGL